MKRTIFLLLLFALNVNCTRAQSFEETSTKTFEAQALKIVLVDNVNGFVKAQAYDGNRVEMTVRTSIKADNEKDLQSAKENYQLKSEISGDSLMIYLDDKSQTWSPQRKRNWEKRDRNFNCSKADFRLDITLKIPKRMAAWLSTINEGFVEADGLEGDVVAHNINGIITLTNMGGNVECKTINGNVKVNFTKAPTADCTIHSFNGDVRVGFPQNLSAELFFKTNQGEFYTDFSIAQYIPAQMTKNVKQENNKTVYQVNEKTGIQIGKGGVKINFETFNGDITVSKL